VPFDISDEYHQDLLRPNRLTRAERRAAAAYVRRRLGSTGVRDVLDALGLR
jgi:hypothetical protein